MHWISSMQRFESAVLRSLAGSKKHGRRGFHLNYFSWSLKLSDYYQMLCLHRWTLLLPLFLLCSFKHCWLKANILLSSQIRLSFLVNYWDFLESPQPLSHLSPKFSFQYRETARLYLASGGQKCQWRSSYLGFFLKSASFSRDYAVLMIKRGLWMS